jgi:hypothetical protein
MTIDLEADLRREFDAATLPNNLTFSPDSVVRQGDRAIRRRRIVAVGSAAMAVALVATGASLLTRPHNTAAPLPASRTATTGIIRAQLDGTSGIASFQVEFNRDAGVRSDVSFSVIGLDGKHHDLGAPSIGKPGQTPGSTWRSGMVDGHPYTVGVVPGTSLNVGFAGSASYGIESNEVPGTGYTIFSVGYKNGNDKEAAQPAQIATISWSGPTGIVDGIEGDHRLSGRTINIDSSVSVELMLQPGAPGRTSVSGDVGIQTATDGASQPMTTTSTDASGGAVVSGRYPIKRPFKEGTFIGFDGAPMAAGILPPGATNIVVILTTNQIASGVPVQERLPDGRVIFALKAQGPHPSQPSKDSIKTIIWTNTDGSQGRIAVTQKQGG